VRAQLLLPEPVHPGLLRLPPRHRGADKPAHRARLQVGHPQGHNSGHRLCVGHPRCVLAFLVFPGRTRVMRAESKRATVWWCSGALFFVPLTSCVNPQSNTSSNKQTINQTNSLGDFHRAGDQRRAQGLGALPRLLLLHIPGLARHGPVTTTPTSSSSSWRRPHFPFVSFPMSTIGIR
jgi:hypothetical protein